MLAFGVESFCMMHDDNMLFKNGFGDQLFCCACKWHLHYRHQKKNVVHVKRFFFRLKQDKINRKLCVTSKSSSQVLEVLSNDLVLGPI